MYKFYVSLSQAEVHVDLTSDSPPYECGSADPSFLCHVSDSYPDYDVS